MESQIVSSARPHLNACVTQMYGDILLILSAVTSILQVSFKYPIHGSRWYSAILGSRTTHLKFDLIGLQTHDFQVVIRKFHVPEMLILTTEPPGTSHITEYIQCQTG